jgi:hypothetical protein
MKNFFMRREGNKLGGKAKRDVGMGIENCKLQNENWKWLQPSHVVRGGKREYSANEWAEHLLQSRVSSR